MCGQCRLTKRFEGGAIKCGSYWTDGTYGPLHLQLLSTTGGEDEQEKAVSGFNFHVGTDTSSSDAPNIHRVFLLTHDGYPDSPPRKITQIQCVSWPDFDVPEDPHTLLGLVKEVDQASEEMAADADDREHKPPVLVHCKLLWISVMPFFLTPSIK
jgi:protein tyrosine phosphatase